MPEKKVTRKVISRAPDSASADGASPVKEARPKRFCHFCKLKTIPTYTDIVTLRRFLTDRAKILPRARSGVCSKHQRLVSRNIKYARHLALLPFTPKV